MAAPSDIKEQVIYHTILAEMHRLHAVMLNMQTLDNPDTEQALREHFMREQSLALGKLSEWKKRRPALYQQAYDDFQAQVRRA